MTACWPPRRRSPLPTLRCVPNKVLSSKPDSSTSLFPADLTRTCTRQLRLSPAGLLDCPVWNSWPTRRSTSLGIGSSRRPSRSAAPERLQLFPRCLTRSILCVHFDDNPRRLPVAKSSASADPGRQSQYNCIP